MSGVELVTLIHTHRLRVFTTSDILALTRMAPAAATHALARLAQQGLLIRIKRGVWVSRLPLGPSPYEAVPYLAAPWPAYVSLHSALADYGVVEEIPHVVFVVCPARPRRYRTALGEFHIHHLPERLMWGYEIKRVDGGGYPMATPEKAFLDLVYLALTPRSSLQLPYRRARRWTWDRVTLGRAAKRFHSHRLTSWLKEEGLL
jgi:predicted transcriptional regulator of viral defense system